MANRLAAETSPYLRQHADNPVSWWPWSKEALMEAQRLNRPILLSIGYAACHWCHVMAHECFETAEIADLMNQWFINIKVDREERPDLDAIYQKALAVMGQPGGWPLTMVLTPQGEPFWGGTYFPPTPRYGRPSFPQVLKTIHQAWNHQGDMIRTNVGALRQRLQEDGRRRQSPVTLSLDMVDHAAMQLLTVIDPVHGGLKGAPKFPQPHLFSFLWQAAQRSKKPGLYHAVTLTLECLCQGGIYDHLGGGFMRYSTDEEWLVPHFEKMLYDNAQLISLLAEVWRETKDPLFHKRITETIDWMGREMTGEANGFSSALDADSEGEEGKFYRWDFKELESVLSSDQMRALTSAYDIDPGGNWEGAIILRRIASFAPSIDEALSPIRQTLWTLREQRPRPGRDDKILADWNGMAIAALVRAGQYLDRPDWIVLAQNTFSGLHKALTLPGDRLAHSLCREKPSDICLLDDLAHMSFAALALYEATGHDDYLRQAILWVESANRHFWDQDQVDGYFQVSHDATDAIVRIKPYLDSATPSANGIMAQILAKLWLITEDPAFKDRAEGCLRLVDNRLENEFPSMTTLLSGFEILATAATITIHGELSSSHTWDLHRTAQRLKPSQAVLRFKPSHKTEALICCRNTCFSPVTTPDQLARTIEDHLI